MEGGCSVFEAQIKPSEEHCVQPKQINLLPVQSDYPKLCAADQHLADIRADETCNTADCSTSHADC